MRRKIPIALCVSVMAASVAAIAYGDENQAASADGVPQVTAIEQGALDAMSRLQRPRTTTDQMPADIARAIDAHASFGMNPGLSRLAVAQATHSVYVIPARGHVCAALTAGDGAALTCPRTNDVAAGNAGAATKNVDGNAVAIYGLVPDGVETVTVETGESTAVSVDTDNNVYYTVVEAGTALRSLSYTGPSGPVAWPIYDPSLAFDEE